MAGDNEQTYLSKGQDQHLYWRKLFMSKAKLKASSRTSGLMSGFAMVAMVELSLDKDDSVPTFLYILFSLFTTILISVHVFALMISVCILPNIETAEAMNKQFDSPEGGIRLSACESPHMKLQVYVEVAWIFSTGLGTLLFLMEIPILMWVKFYRLSEVAGYISTFIMVPVCVLFVIFAMHFYRKLIEYKYSRSTKRIEELQIIATQLDKVEVGMISDSPTM